MRGLIQPGDNVTISREVLIDFVTSSFQEFNLKYKDNRDISRAFEICGLNPFCNDDYVFRKHLNSLDENRLYESLSRNQEPVDCAAIDVIQKDMCRKLIRF